MPTPSPSVSEYPRRPTMSDGEAAFMGQFAQRVLQKHDISVDRKSFMLNASALMRGDVSIIKDGRVIAIIPVSDDASRAQVMEHMRTGCGISMTPTPDLIPEVGRLLMRHPWSIAWDGTEDRRHESTTGAFMDDIRRTQDILHVARHHESKVREAAQAASIPMQRVRLYIHDILGKEDPVSQVIEEAVASGFGVQREPEPSLPWTDIWAAMWIIPAATPASLERSLPGGPSTPKALVIDESVAEPVVVRSTD